MANPRENIEHIEGFLPVLPAKQTLSNLFHYVVKLDESSTLYCWGEGFLISRCS
eukprot:jgi/Bigna1/64600/fgenesh1_kg.80_\